MSCRTQIFDYIVYYLFRNHQESARTTTRRQRERERERDESVFYLPEKVPPISPAAKSPKFIRNASLSKCIIADSVTEGGDEFVDSSFPFF
jgi:hypothetical protein